MSHPFMGAEHETFRAELRRFIQAELEPHVEEWEAAGEVPRAIYQRAAEVGLLGVGYPEEYGGIPAPDTFYKMIAVEELARTGSGGLVAALGSLGIGIPPIVALGSAELKARCLPPVLRGEKIAALAITEPGGGSDVANLSTSARREGDHYVINGQKTFITSGMRADVLTVAVRTGGEGMGGISLLMVEGDSPGLSRTPLHKMGWLCSDTATLYFQDCRVPAANLIGTENQGFLGIMRNFNNERLALATQAYGQAQACWEEAAAYAQERQTFGKALIRHQVIRHKLVEMASRLRAVRATLDQLIWRVDQGEVPIADLCMLKTLATDTAEFVAGEAVQILGGAGYMRGCKSERVFRETKVLSIGGGASEIMRDLAARQLGL